MEHERDFERRLDRAGRRPPALRDRLGEGKPLAAAVRARWEWAFGSDLSSVRVHDDAAGDAVAAGQSAAAFAAGEDIGFRAGAYRPGTLAGDALLAHELAHVVQQQGATSAGGAASNAAAESDANRAAVAGLAGVAGGPRMRTGLRLAACETRPEPPSYLGPASRTALARIERITTSLGLADDMIVYGTILTMGASPPHETLAQGLDVMPQAQALFAIPVITYERVLTVIELLLLDHENDMNEQERRFWHRMHDRTSELMQAAVTRQQRATTRTSR